MNALTPLFEDSRLVSEPIQIPYGGQLTFTAIDLPKNIRVQFRLAIVGSTTDPTCECDVRRGLPGVSAVGPLVKIGISPELNEHNSYVIIDAPQRMYVQAYLTYDNKDLEPEDQDIIPLVYYSTSRTSDVSELQRGYVNG